MDIIYWIKSISVLGLGIFTLLWTILKIIASIFISLYLTNTFTTFTGYGWWFCVIIIFSIICRLILHNDIGDNYTRLVDKTMKHNNDSLDIALDNIMNSNPIFNCLNENYALYDTKITFTDNTTLIIDKNQNANFDGDFIFLLSDTEGVPPAFDKGFNINNIQSIERID